MADPRTLGPRRTLVSVAVVVAVLGTAGGLSAMWSGVPGGRPAPAGASPSASPTFTLTWSTTALGDIGQPIAESSPTLADLPGGPSVVVGDRAGRLYAFHLAAGSGAKASPVTGWPAATGPPITSTPSVATLGTDPYDSVFVGAGNAAEPTAGGYYGFSSGGNPLWYSQVTDPGSDAQPAYGVQASLTVGAFSGQGPDVVAGSLDQEEYALDAADGSDLTGWPFFTSDSVFSTASLADLYGTGGTEIIEGGDQTAGFGLGQNYTQGGHVRVLSPSGDLVCNHDTDQTVDSSPAVGGFLAEGAMGVVVGTGKFFGDSSDTDHVIALDADCNLAWSTALDGVTTSSPALADVGGTGKMDVVEATQTSTTAGTVWVLTGASGSPLWHVATKTTGTVIGSVTTADLTGQGYQDLLVPTTHGVDIVDGRSHSVVKVLDGKATATTFPSLGFQNSPLVTDDPNGTIGITLAGYGGPDPAGYILHYEIPDSNGTEAVGAGSWPQFHHDNQLTGNAGTAVPPATPACQVPAAARGGYDLVASDGGIFSFGGAPFCGSTGGTNLNAPVVGMAMAPSTGGYWLVASDGGVFAYGDAKYFGSMGGMPLNAPIVAIAATPDGKGYWLVAADGGIFAYGDAKYFGSMGGMPLNAPIVGMAATGDGQGYRLVAADGGIFAYGNAQYFGSMGGKTLVAPIVGLADDVATAGYWMVAADGGIFAFGGAPFMGSMGGMPLTAPVVGIAATENGAGYRMTASDGGIFAFGGDGFFGSEGGEPLNRPVVGMAGP